MFCARLKNGQTREVVLPSPRAKTISGQGVSHSVYFFSRSVTCVMKGQITVVESRLGERNKL